MHGNLKKRRVISDYTESLLKAEIVNRCPMCGAFEETTRGFTNHHINGDPSVSEYWNLIRICSPCHDGINEQDGKKERKIRQIKKDLFRRLIGDASYQVLLMANSLEVTSTLPCLAMTLLKMGLVEKASENPLHVGVANHPTIMDFMITHRGRELISQLNIREDIPI